MRRLAFGLALAIPLFVTNPLSVSAGGSWMETTKDSYEEGDKVIAVGYVAAGLAEGEYLIAYLVIPGQASEESQRLEVGRASVEPSGLLGYLSNRVYVEFTIPEIPEPGIYELAVRRSDGEFHGDLIGASLHIGVEPDYPKSVEWPLDEPLIAELPEDAMISGPGFSVLVSDLRKGIYPPGAASFMLDPSLLDQDGVVTTTISIPSTTTVPPTTTSDVDVAPDVESGATSGSGSNLVRWLAIPGVVALTGVAIRRNRGSGGTQEAKGADL
jgi:hypothetical protein